MNIKTIQIEVDTQSINPMLKIWVNLEFDYSNEIPVSISGKLCHQNGQILSVLSEYQLNTDSRYGLTLRTEQQKEERGKNTEIHSVQLSALLTPKAIESIEKQREKAQNKSAEFYMEFVLKTMNIPVDFNNLQNNHLVRLNIEKKSERYSIEQSDWVANFSPKLGIGNFLLLELNIAKNQTSESWTELIDLLKTNILEMERCIMLGEWKKTIEYSRQFFDGLNIKSSGRTNPTFENKLREVLLNEQHNEEGINDLLKGIKSLFDFTSKYVHPKDRAGILKPYPNSGKEDAYLVYTLSIGLFNLVTSKLQK
ncbi:hypothetical protein [Ascidiimonas aurantiaca]|uniref:hypothetical protein n=1 Tax=Ascidiimonas aurantiaca TaxID=1685432 RepID=UPI0030EC3751